jgi:hypothetical protein
MEQDWIDEGAWYGFMEMRRTIKKPMTERAISMVINRLEKLKQNGHDVNACLDQSTLHCWQDIYPLKDTEIPNMKREYNRTAEAPMTREQKTAADIVRREVMSVVRLVKAA